MVSSSYHNFHVMQLSCLLFIYAVFDLAVFNFDVRKKLNMAVIVSSFCQSGCCRCVVRSAAFYLRPSGIKMHSCSAEIGSRGYHVYHNTNWTNIMINQPVAVS